MGFLAFMKGMKIEGNLPSEMVFRTSKSSGVFGAGLLFAGTALLVQVLLGNTIFGAFRLLAFLSVGISLVFISGGLFLLSSGRSVRINLWQSRIDVAESSLLSFRQYAFNFHEFEQIEICAVAECLISTHCRFYTLKGYVRRDNRLRCVRLFESPNQNVTEEAARFVAQTLGKEIIRSTSQRVNSAVPTFPPLNAVSG